MNRALIDTDILSYYFKGHETVKRNFHEYLKFYSKIETSIITHYEITGGLLAKNADKQLKIYDAFISHNTIVPLSENSVYHSAYLYAILKRTGKIVDNIDLLIAGIALENKMTLVTNNENHFIRLTDVSDLKIENWNTL